MQPRTEREQVQARFAEMARGGLLDAKFCLSNENEASTEEVYREINALFSALDDGRYRKLDFCDASER